MRRTAPILVTALLLTGGGAFAQVQPAPSYAPDTIGRAQAPLPADPPTRATVDPASPVNPAPPVPTPPSPGATAAVPNPDDGFITSALSGGPRAIADKATLMAVEKDGTLRFLRAGTGRFTCVSDNPLTPTADPMCADMAGLDWVKAYLRRQSPSSNRAGFVYCMAGQSASNSDPYATAATDSNNWLKIGPHLKIVGASAIMSEQSWQLNAPVTEPFVMWNSTPYQHLVVPLL